MAGWRYLLFHQIDPLTDRRRWLPFGPIFLIEYFTPAEYFQGCGPA